jgi:hypothetical protein
LWILQLADEFLHRRRQTDARRPPRVIPHLPAIIRNAGGLRNLQVQGLHIQMEMAEGMP